MKNGFNILLSLILFFSVPFSFFACTKNNSDDVNYDAKNVIILIGDGMGFNHIENAKTYFILDTQTFENNYIGSVNTNSLSSGPTDSAAAATAIATGVSVMNGQISQNDTGYLKHIMEVADENNMLTGIITNDTLTGATPAAFSAHARSRGDIADIISTQSDSPLDLMIGKYDSVYYENEELFASKGFTLCDNKEDLYNTDFPQKVIANLNNIYSIYNPNYVQQTPLVDLVNYAINFLDNENGFVLMVECAYIDKFSHNNDIISALAEVRTLFDIANFVQDYIDKHKNTALIISADHETGGLQKASSKKDITNSLFSTGAHTDSQVPLYARGITIENPTEIKNRYIYNWCCEIINN